jgi:hypothetical protein
MPFVSITPAQGKRISNAVKRAESAYTPDQRRGRSDNWNPGILRARCTTAIPTGTFDSPSNTGEVQIYALNRLTDAWEESGDPVTVWNQLTLDADVAVDTAVFVSWISGAFWLIQADCPPGGE